VSAGRKESYALRAGAVKRLLSIGSHQWLSASKQLNYKYSWGCKAIGRNKIKTMQLCALHSKYSNYLKQGKQK